jgi:protein ImuA
VRAESLRRLHLAAQQGKTLFYLFRPLAEAVDPSPAPLRLSVQPAPGGINVGFVKRQGLTCEEPLFLPMEVAPNIRTLQRHHVVPATAVPHPAIVRAASSSRSGFALERQ